MQIWNYTIRMKFIQYKWKLYNTNRKIYNINRKLYNINGVLYNTHKKLYNTNKKLYNINKKDQILQRLTYHTLELLLYVHLNYQWRSSVPKSGGGGGYTSFFSRKPKKYT